MKTRGLLKVYTDSPASTVFKRKDV